MKEHIEILSEVTGYSVEDLRQTDFIPVCSTLEAMRIAVEQENGWVSVEDGKLPDFCCWVYIQLYKNSYIKEIEEVEEYSKKYITHFLPIIKPSPPIK